MQDAAKEMTLLTDTAKELGATTAFSATQASNAFIEMGKLGLNTAQIISASQPVLNLAAATGEDMAKSAETMASALGQFNLDASESARVSDVMAKSFVTSALDLTKFSESMKAAGPVASATNVSIEETTAALGVLSNAAISGSAAGTAMKNILIQLADEGGKVGQTLQTAATQVDEFVKRGVLTQEVADRIKEVGIQNASMTDKLKLLKATGMTATDTFDKFGRIAGTAAINLIKNADAIETMDQSLQSANGSAKEMAEKRLDSIQGQTKLLDSALEGLGLQLFDTFSDAKKEGIKDTTSLIGELSKFVERNKESLKFWAEAFFDAISFLKTTTMNFVLAMEIAFKSVSLAIVTSFEMIMAGVKTTLNIGIKAINAFRDEGNKLEEMHINFEGTKELATEIAEASKQLVGLPSEKTIKIKTDIGSGGKVSAAQAGAEDIDPLAMGDSDKLAKAAKKRAEEAAKAVEEARSIARQQTLKAMDDQREAELLKQQQKFEELLALDVLNNTQRQEIEIAQREAKLALEEQWRMEDVEKARAVEEEVRLARLSEGERELEELRLWYEAKKEIVESGEGNITDLELLMEAKKNEILKNQRIKDNAQNEAMWKQRMEITSNYANGILGVMEAVQGQSKQLAAARKAVAIGEATVNTYLAATNAMATVPYPTNFVAAGSVIAAGLGSVAKIATQKFASGGIVQNPGVSASGDNVPAMLNPGEMVLNQRQQANMFDQLNGTGGGSQGVTINGPTLNFTDSGMSRDEVMGIISDADDDFQLKVARTLREIDENRVTA